MNNPVLKHPSAWIPLALSLVMLAFILTYLALSGVPAPKPNADEGVGARLFQMWLVLEVLLMAFFSMTWLPRAPRQALQVLTLQVGAVLVTCAPIFLLGL